jgi:tetratricopeptide (TPR) repeat protein
MPMRPLLSLALLAVLAVTIPAAPVGAVMGGSVGPAPSAAGGDEYAAGVAAFDQQDWQGVIDHMAKVIEDRPWEDQAYNLSGFAYRKLGKYNQALEFYDTALKLNPHNLGALEYLGEAYLDMDRPKDAQAMLDRLDSECQRLAKAVSTGGAQPDCEERQDLEEALAVYHAGKS